MEHSHEFLNQILDSITEHIVVIDELGDIQFVNKSWASFGNNNACLIGENWKGINYIEECDKAAAMGDELGDKAGKGIRRVIAQQEPAFYFEYPCHSPTEKRWFMMRATPFQTTGKNYFVISHQNITERKLAEEKVISLASIDGLTQIPNRRTYNEFLHNEWKRCLRHTKPISLAIIDLDHFKLLNDTYGHQAGDECLIRVAALLKDYANRPGDICARYGGEEFSLVWGDTTMDQAKHLADGLITQINALNIQNKNAPTNSHLTASIGLASLIPQRDRDENALIAAADNKLYQAKEGGRNCVEY